MADMYKPMISGGPQPVGQPSPYGGQQSGSFGPVSLPFQQAPNAGFSNPYLGAQADAITRQANQNLTQNLMPTVHSGAQAAGGYGGSRQGIAQGIAMGQTQQGVANSLANMYGSAYQNDQNLANQWGIAGMNNDTSRYNANLGLQGTMYGADSSRAASMYGADSSRMASMYGADQGLAGQRYGADSSRAASMYGADQSLAGQRYSADTSYGIAGLNNSTQRYLGDQSNGTQRYIADQNYNLGMGNLGLGYFNGMNNYNLGMGNLGLNTNIANQNFYTSQRGQDLQQYQIGGNMFNSGVNGDLGLSQGMTNVGQQYMNAPYETMSRYSNIMSPYSGMGGSQVGTSNGSMGANVMGGAIAGAQIGRNINFGGTGYVPGYTGNQSNGTLQDDPNWLFRD